MPGFLLPYHILSLSLLGQLASCQVDIIISQSPPGTAAYVSQSFVSLSIEGDRWTDWVGIPPSRNDFFFNTLDNLKQLTGVPPQIRIGANSADNTVYYAGVPSENIYPKVTTTNPYPEAMNITINGIHYQATQLLPQNTSVIWGVNLKRKDKLEVFNEVWAIMSVFSSPPIKDAGILLEAIEVGNEPDLYEQNGARPPTYALQYVSDWNNLAGILRLPIKFWGASFAASSHSTSGFSPQAIFDGGIRSSVPGSMISTISQHHYSSSSCSGTEGRLEDLMTKATIRSNLSAFVPDIEATNEKGLAYVLGEANSCSCHGAPGVSDTAGAALWALDYLLFASQLNISRVFFHQGIGFRYNLIQPITLDRSTVDGSSLSTPLPPHIHPQYYAAIIAAEAIGNSNNTQITELNITTDTKISGYAFYQGGQLTKVILINSLCFFTTTTTPRPSTHVNVNLTTTTLRPSKHVNVNLTFASGTVPSQMNVKRLIVPHADDTSGLTWGGQTYETRVSGIPNNSTVDVTDGVDIQATEVVMLTFII